MNAVLANIRKNKVWFARHSGQKNGRFSKIKIDYFFNGKENGFENDRFIYFLNRLQYVHTHVRCVIVHNKLSLNTQNRTEGA